MGNPAPAAKSCVLPLLLAIAILPVSAADASLTLEQADDHVAVASRLVEGGIYGQAADLALAVLNDPAFRESGNAPDPSAQQWLKRREAARFLLERSRLGLADDRDDYLDIGDEFALLFRNRYRLDEPEYNLQSAYWAGRAYQQAGDYERAVAMYGRVGGFNLPQGMEGDAARRTSECLRRMAENIPYPGTQQDRQKRNRLLDRAIDELDRARQAFPVGRGRKELELDLIALRLARRQDDFVREALGEADAFLAGEAARDELRARAALYRGMAAERLGDIEDAVKWFRSVLETENPSPADRRETELALALALRELSESGGQEERTSLLAQSVDAFRMALADSGDDRRWDRARTLLAATLLDLNQPTAALEAVEPIIKRRANMPAAWFTAGRAELARGRPGEALELLYPAARPSNASSQLRLTALQSAAQAARALGNQGAALALLHRASRMLRRDRVYSALLESEFSAMEMRLRLGRSGGPLFLAGDPELLRSRNDFLLQPIETKRKGASAALANALGGVFASGGDADGAHDLALRAEAALAWADAGIEDLEIAVGMIGHLRNRRPAGVTERVLLSREGEANYALALGKANALRQNPNPAEEEIEQVLSYFTMAASSFQAASAGGVSGADALDLGVVNLTSGGFLLDLAERLNRGKWAASAVEWRREAQSRLEASLKPFDQALASYGPGGLPSMRARWSKARAQELLEEWRSAANGYFWLMNNSEAPRILRINAARHWGACMERLGEAAQGLARLEGFARVDAGVAFLAGRLAEQGGDAAAAYGYYLFASDPENALSPPEPPGLRQEAAYRAARLALADPMKVDPEADPADLKQASRDLLEKAASADLTGPWAGDMLEELAKSWMDEEPDGWKNAHRIAVQAAENPAGDAGLKRSMHILAAQALRKGGNLPEALDELDMARELAGDAEGQEARDAAAAITLLTAEIYREQGRPGDALRAYADVFATYPDAEETADAARVAAAKMLLSLPDAGSRETDQARSILSGLRNRALAEEILR